MAHAASAHLRGIADVLAAIRALPEIQERRPGIFYVRRLPFRHFHVPGGRSLGGREDGDGVGTEDSAAVRRRRAGEIRVRARGPRPLRGVRDYGDEILPPPITRRKSERDG